MLSTRIERTWPGALRLEQAATCRKYCYLILDERHFASQFATVGALSIIGAIGLTCNNRGVLCKGIVVCVVYGAK